MMMFSTLTIPHTLDASGFSNEDINLIGVERNKKTISHLTNAFNIINVPTVIVMKERKEPAAG